MKPRLERARMTIEDEAVWIRALHRTVMPSYVWHWYEKADRRDADLMFALERMRGHWFLKHNRPADYPPSWPIVMTVMRAEFATSGTYDITNCA